MPFSFPLFFVRLEGDVGQTKLENGYQGELIKRIYAMFPGCFILKNDSSYRQGIPDLLILFGNKWAILEVKRKRPTRESDWEPNQREYIALLDRMSFSDCIFPENEEDVLSELRKAFRVA